MEKDGKPLKRRTGFISISYASSRVCYSVALITAISLLLLLPTLASSTINRMSSSSSSLSPSAFASSDGADSKVASVPSAATSPSSESASLAMVAADLDGNNITAKTPINTTTTTIPEGAKGPAIPAAKGYLVQEIRDGLYWVTDGTYNTMFLVTAKGVVAVDAPPSLGQNYLKAIREVTDKPVKYVIYSHSHLDHIGAAAAIFKNATFVAHEETAKELQRAHELATARNATFASQLPPIPTITFKENYTISLPKLGSENQNQTLQLAYYGNNHVPGNIYIYAPNQKVLMLVDIVFPGWVPFMQLAIAQDVTGFVQAHDIALRYNFDTFVGGHLTRLGTRQDVQIQKQFIMDLIAASAKANAAVSFSDIAKQLGNTSDTWLFYNTYVNAVTKKCTDEMMSKWGDKLGGAQAFMPSHCTAMTEALRVDPSVAALAPGVQVS